MKRRFLFGWIGLMIPGRAQKRTRKYFITGGYSTDAKGPNWPDCSKEPLEVMAESPMEALIGARFTVWTEEQFREAKSRTKGICPPEKQP